MKRIFRIGLIMLCLLTAVGFTACAPAMERFAPLISELRDNVLTAESERFTVSVITGRREDPFILDGMAGEMRDYTLITVTPAAATEAISYKTNFGGTEYQGQMNPHPFAKSFSVEIAARLYETEISLTLTDTASSEDLTVRTVKTEQMITSAKAVEIAERRLGDSIASFKDTGEYECEIFVRLIANPVDNSGGYHWYVAFIGKDQTIYAVLIDPVSMEIVAIRD